MINKLIYDFQEKRNDFIKAQNDLLTSLGFKNFDHEKPLSFYGKDSYEKIEKSKDILKIFIEDTIWGDKNYFITIEIDFFKIINNYILIETIYGEIIIIEQKI